MSCSPSPNGGVAGSARPLVQPRAAVDERDRPPDSVLGQALPTSAVLARIDSVVIAIEGIVGSRPVSS